MKLKLLLILLALAATVWLLIGAVHKSTPVTHDTNSISITVSKSLERAGQIADKQAIVLTNYIFAEFIFIDKNPTNWNPTNIEAHFYHEPIIVSTSNGPVWTVRFKP